MLKMLPTLLQQDGDGIRHRLRGLPARRLIVSFPVRSLGGRDKGMLEHYSDVFDGLLGDMEHRRELLPGELIYSVTME